MMPKQALIVDDSQLAQFVLKKMLKEENIVAECSGSAEEALEYLKSNQPDIIFLDHTMPGMNGLELLQLLKEDPDTEGIPVMMYTSQEDKHYAEKAFSLGAMEVLPKQLKRPDLHRVLITLDNNSTITTVHIDDDDDILEQVVYDAEEALKHETWQQRFKHSFEEHRDNTNAQLTQLNERLDRLMLHQDELPQKRQLFWNNVFWMVLFCIALGVFSFIYTQQQQTLQEIKINASTTQTPQLAGQTVTPVIIQTAPTPENVNERNTSIVNDFQELEEYFNINTIPFGEVLLGPTALTILEEIDTILSAEPFQGIVRIQPLDSVFCVRSGTQGNLVLAEANTALGDCVFSQINTELAENISVEVQQFINARNNINGSYRYAITPVQNNFVDVAQLTGTSNAGDWNTQAAANRRVAFTLQPNP